MPGKKKPFSVVALIIRDKSSRINIPITSAISIFDDSITLKDLSEDLYNTGSPLDKIWIGEEYVIDRVDNMGFESREIEYEYRSGYLILKEVSDGINIYARKKYE